MTLTIRHPWRIALAVVLGLLAIGALLELRDLDRGTPAYHLNLIGTTWTVASIEHWDPLDDHQNAHVQRRHRCRVDGLWHV